jgi:hypothetical protein
MSNGIKIIPSSMRKNSEACSETRKKRALAVDKNMLPRHRRDRLGWLSDQIAVFSFAAR